jgi:hypothetical protein
MQDPEPPVDHSGWKPTTSTVAGGGIGTSVAIVLAATYKQVFKTDIDPNLAIAGAGLLVSIIGYFFPDGGRK